MIRALLLLPWRGFVALLGWILRKILPSFGGKV